MTKTTIQVSTPTGEKLKKLKKLTRQPIGVLADIGLDYLDGAIRRATRAAFAQLQSTPDAQPWPPAQNSDPVGGDGTWPFRARIDGDDIVCENIVITCFGGADDPQDNGDTASGLNTKRHPDLSGVSIAMDGRSFAHLSPAEHRALDGSPFPKMPFGTLVEVTIGERSFIPPAGIIDLGPGKQATRNAHEPHALDLTVAAAAHFQPGTPAHVLARNFEARGSFRILGGAKYVSA